MVLQQPSLGIYHLQANANHRKDEQNTSFDKVFWIVNREKHMQQNIKRTDIRCIEYDLFGTILKFYYMSKIDVSLPKAGFVGFSGNVTVVTEQFPRIGNILKSSP